MLFHHPDIVEMRDLAKESEDADAVMPGTELWVVDVTTGEQRLFFTGERASPQGDASRQAPLSSTE